MSAYLTKIEPWARRVWVPLSLSFLLVVTWLVFEQIHSSYWTTVAARLFLTLGVVLGLQIFSGNSGVLSFGHTAFMAIGAYASALLTMSTAMKQLNLEEMPHFLSSWIFPAHLGVIEGTLVGGGFALAFAILTAAPISRLSGIAGGIATLAIIVIVNVFITQTPSVTKGEETMIGVPATTSLLAIMVWGVIFVFVAFAFQQSKIGLRLRASRENQRAAQSVGVRVTRERSIAWMLSAVVVGITGALYAHYFNNFNATDFYFNNGLDIVLVTVAMLVIGGMTSVTGAVVGCYAVTIVYTVFDRWSVSGYFGYTPPSGIANLAAAAMLLLVLILAPVGLSRGREIPWPSEWHLPSWMTRRARRGSTPILPESQGAQRVPSSSHSD